MKGASRKLSSVVRSRYWRRVDAQVVIAAWRKSGESLSEFSLRWSLKSERIARWAAQIEEKNESVRFHPLRVVDWEEAAQDEPGVVIDGRILAEVVGERWTVCVRSGFDADELSRLLQVVEEVESC